MRARSWAQSAALLALLVLTAALRLRLLDVPLERDEGEYAYLGQLVLRGEVPYLAAHNMKLPGMYYAYAAIFALFGESVRAIHAGLLVANLASIVLVERLGRRLVDATAGLVAAAAFSMLSLSDSVDGFSAQGESFIVPLAVAGALLLADPAGARRSLRIAAAGLLFGMAYLVKQHAAAFAAFGVACVLSDGLGRAPVDARFRVRAALLLVGAALLPFALLCTAMLIAGAFEPFWFWTVRYAREYVSFIPLATGLAELGRQSGAIVSASPALWSLAAIGLIALWSEPIAPARRFLLLFALFSFLAVCPGLRFSVHYFVLLLPAAGLLAGVAVSALGRLAERRGAALARAVRVGLPLLAVAATLVQARDYLFVLTPPEIARSVFGANPFPESIELARFLRERARPGDQIAVIGSEPQIYFYSGLHAATSYLYMYPLMEPQPFARAMQDDMIAQLERAKPRFLVLVNVDTSWSRRPDSSLRLLEWAEQTVDRDYRPIARVEITPGEETTYRFGDRAGEAPARSRFFVMAFERRT